MLDEDYATAIEGFSYLVENFYSEQYVKRLRTCEKALERKKKIETDRRLTPEQQAWMGIRNSDRLAGYPCRESSCGHDRMTLAYYCPRHQFERLFGSLPPRIPKQ